MKETDFPSGHAESYVYDAMGNLITKTDRNGNAITYVYDALNRMTHKGYPDGTGVDYIYDLVGGSVPKVVEKHKGESAEEVE